MGEVIYVRRSGRSGHDLHVIGKSSGGVPTRVLCVVSGSGEKTLPVFTDREAARRFLRASPLRFGLLGSGWRATRVPGSELGALLVAISAVGTRRVAVDPTPETLVGGCSPEPLAIAA